MVNAEPLLEWTNRIRAEYIEMPGLSLTLPQMRRLWLLDPRVCDAAIDALVAAAFLRRRDDDSYVRRESRV